MDVHDEVWPRGQSRRKFVMGVFAGVGASMAVGSGEPSLSAEGGQIRSFDHVAVPIQNTNAMVQFYRELGFTVMEGASICSVHFGDNKINFHRPERWQNESFTLRASAARPPCGDFCFVWDGTADALHSALNRVDAEVIQGPVIRVGGRDGGNANGTSYYIRDPDDNLLEFIIY